MAKMTAIANRLEKLAAHKGPLSALLSDLEQRGMGRREVSELIEQYYRLQKDRIRNENRVRSLRENGERADAMAWLTDESLLMEGLIQKMIEIATEHDLGCRWMRSIHGIGPVLAAGIAAHVDVTKSKTAGGVWRFFGLDPSVTWSKGQRRPWCALAKTLAWKAGESFVKASASEKDFYGAIYRRRKAYEWRKNVAGDYADQARAAVGNVGTTTDTHQWYAGTRQVDCDLEQWIESGMKATELRTVTVKGGTQMLPPARIQARAKRYAVKLFLSHVHAVFYWIQFGTPPPVPYILTKSDHTHVIAPPNLDQFEELTALELAIYQAVK